MANTPIRNLRVPDDEWSAFQGLAAEWGLTTSGLIRHCIQTLLLENGRATEAPAIAAPDTQAIKAAIARPSNVVITPPVIRRRRKKAE